MGIARFVISWMALPSRIGLEEAYLQEATSHADLEMRERELARGRFDRHRRR